jgi:prevent-host-death family protein
MTSMLKFPRNLAAFLQRARFEPIEITRHGRRAFVLVSAEHFDWMQAANQRAYRARDAAEVVMDAVERETTHPDHVALDELLK